MNIGVVGAGWWGKNIVNTLESVDRVEHVVVFDALKDAYAKFSNNKKTVFADSLDGLLSDPSVSGVCLATPPRTHFEYSRQILLAGKHLLVEKPPAMLPSQIVELGTIAKNKNLTYMLDALYLFLEPVKRLKMMLDSGELKNLRYIQMFRIGDEMRREGAGLERLRTTMFANGVDVIEDLFFHDAALCLHLFGDFQFQSVEKLCLYHASLPDTARIRLGVGAIPIDLTLSWTLAGRRRGIVLYDRDFVVEYDGLKSENQLTKYDLAGKHVTNFSFPNVAPLGAMLEFFIDCFQGKQKNTLDSFFMERMTTIWRSIIDG